MLGYSGTLVKVSFFPYGTIDPQPVKYEVSPMKTESAVDKHAVCISFDNLTSFSKINKAMSLLKTEYF